MAKGGRCTHEFCQGELLKLVPCWRVKPNAAADENGNRTEYRYSVLGNIIEVVDALGNSTKYGYNKARRITKVEQTRLIDDVLANLKKTEQQVTTYERNQKGLVTLVHLPLEKTVKLLYNGIKTSHQS